MTQDKQAMLDAVDYLAQCDHAFLNKKGVEKASKPFGVTVRTWTHQSDPTNPKGLTLKDGAAEAEGRDAADVAVALCDALKIQTAAKMMMGRGSRLRQAVESLRKYVEAL